mmetsp:Transcript_27835/g.54823  ORF Transcript_27835/g.54823 Transcript_27835/m.54823 type:complete len:81 (+) Transcript_27835:158-400(+)
MTPDGNSYSYCRETNAATLVAYYLHLNLPEVSKAPVVSKLHSRGVYFMRPAARRSALISSCTFSSISFSLRTAAGLLCQK